MICSARMLIRRGVCLLLFLSLLAAATTGHPGVENYADVLKQRVNERGMVDYRGLKRSPEQLESFLDAIAAIKRADYETWSRDEQIAFWLNAYNGITLKAIIDHYPIEPSFWTSRFYPENSIRQIDGVWDELAWEVMGRKMTLDEIEHGVLRKDFDEPRIHMALVCAAMGCPPLRNEPYVGKRLDAQLNDQTQRFLSNPTKFRIDRKAEEVRLSPIFKWFGEDFISRHPPRGRFDEHSRAEGAVLMFLTQHLEEGDARWLLRNEFDIEYLDYDWSLNEQE